MSTTSDKSSKSSSLQSIWSTQTLVLLAVGLGVAALLFYLLFSVSIPGEGRPYWYGIGTLVFEEIAFLLAAWLCLRNGFSPQIVSGRNVWLGIGFGMLSYFVGNLIFSWWELGWKLDPAVSPGDLFYLISYVCISVGMVLAVKSRRLNLELWQWGVTATIAVAGIALAVWVSQDTLFLSDEVLPEAAIESVVPAESSGELAPAAIAPEIGDSGGDSGGVVAVEGEPIVPVPAWVLNLESYLDPYATPLNLAYVVLDVILLVVATLLLLAFWGGRFSQSWRMIAAAAFSLYIADMWYKYAENNIPNYESGDLLEVFFVFTGIFFAIGAVLEYDVSTRASTSRRSRRRGGS
ncbi:MAG: hypothetical protein WBB29_20145 [Geitlerinemataceae cyanobacterium]